MRPAGGIAPDIDVYGNGRIEVVGNTAFNIKSLNLTFSPSGTTAFQTTCDNITAQSISTGYALPEKTWYFFSPISDVNLSDISILASDGTTPSYALRYYDGAERAANGAGASWKDFTGTTLKAGTGYILQTSKAATLRMPLAQTDFVKVVGRPDKVTFPLAEYPSENSGDQNWNLVANPYAAYYDIYYTDFSAPITIWNGNGYTAYRVLDDNTLALKPMQAFFVQTPEQVSSISFPLEGRQLTSDINHAVNAPDANERTRFLYDLELMYDNKDSVVTVDRTRVVINPEASLDYEMTCDASKFMSFDKTVPQMYTFDDANTRMSINERPLGDGIVRLGLYLPAKTIYTITAPRAQGEVWLYDSETSQETLLSEGAEYSFTSRTGGYSDSRFTLRFNVTPTSIDSVEGESVSVESGEGFIEVKAGADTMVTIASADGVLYYTGEAARVEVPQGVYVVKAGTRTYKTIVK